VGSVLADTGRASDEVAAYCERLGRPKTARRGDVLLRQGEPVGICYYVKRGYAKVLSTSQTGHATLIGFAGPRDVVGQAAAHTWGETYIFTSIAAGHMDLLQWTREMVLGPQQWVLQDMLDALLNYNIHIVMEHFHTGTEGRVSQRLARTLAHLADRHGIYDGGVVALGPRVTRDDLASLANTTLYTASRCMSEWEGDGILAKRHGHIHILNVDGLMELAQA
jgi:CRP-like cAMP-binding protein